MNLQELMWILIPGIAAGLCQSVMSFGSGVIAMLFYPAVIGMVQSASLMQCISIVTCIWLVVRYRKYINFKIIWLPLLLYFPVYLLVIPIAVNMDMGISSIILGICTLATAVYMFFFSNRITIRPSIASALSCAVLGGVIDAFFGNGGLPIVVYLLAILRDKKEYIGTAQMYFLVTCSFGTAIRLSKGILTIDLLPYAVLALIALLAGVKAGMYIVDKVDTFQIKRITCVSLALAGIFTIFSNWKGL